MPRYHPLNCTPKSWTWTIIGLHSNFKNAINHQSYATATFLGGNQDVNFIDYPYPVVKVKDIQYGEVVFVELLLECRTLANNYVFNITTHVVYRGDPINTAFRIFYPKNGKLATEVIYDLPIELQIIEANKNIRAGARYGDTVQSNRQNISEYLSEYDTKITNVSELNLKNREHQYSKVNGKERKLKREVISFIKEENAFYAHGRSIDLRSISTLLRQHPANYFYKNIEAKPDKKLVVEAMENRFSQNPGYNAFIVPMINPALPIKRTKVYFPGRSGHSSVSGGGASCDNTTSNDGSCGPSYEGLSNSVCNIAQTSTSQGWCCDSPCK